MRGKIWGTSKISLKRKKSLHAVELTAGAYAIGQTISEIVTKKGPIQVASFSRNGYKCDAPSDNTLLMAGDILVIEGTQDEIYLSEEKLLQG
jgi:CPA2 family monovalent cation:H+ antiporter-2